MKIFLDTANLDEIRQAALLGVLDGVTTNPTLVASQKSDADLGSGTEGMGVIPLGAIQPLSAPLPMR